MSSLEHPLAFIIFYLFLLFSWHKNLGTEKKIVSSFRPWSLVLRRPARKSDATKGFLLKFPLYRHPICRYYCDIDIYLQPLMDEWQDLHCWWYPWYLSIRSKEEPEADQGDFQSRRCTNCCNCTSVSSDLCDSFVWAAIYCRCSSFYFLSKSDIIEHFDTSNLDSFVIDGDELIIFIFLSTFPD